MGNFQNCKVEYMTRICAKGYKRNLKFPGIRLWKSTNPYRANVYNRLMSTLLREKTLPGRQKVEIAQGDITLEAVDAIVNAANSQLQHGGGVAWAIARRGGEAIDRESRAWVREHGPVTHDRPAFTSGGQMPCQYVIHAVGPAWGEGDEVRKLAAAVRGSLRLADELGLRSIAIPAISTGIFGFPKERAAQVIFAEIDEYFAQTPASGLKLVRLTLFDQPTVDVFVVVWDRNL
jgi:O-acetyl-ADP-ribose deacetylase (regulator of RNase III)